MPSLLSNYLKALNVPHTVTYADSCFASMPFRNLFGLERTLEQFGVESRGLKFNVSADVVKVPVPFLAQIHGGVVIVTGISVQGHATTVTYRSVHGSRHVPLSDFLGIFNGVVLQSKPRPGARERDLAEHRFQEFANRIKMPVLMLVLALLAAYGSVKSGVWDSLFKALVFCFDIAGVAVCYLLWLKTNGVQSKVADSMCGLTTEHGCDKVLDTRLSSFMGIFKWSEVGMGYFAVSLLVFLAFPGEWPTLALFNACCLPYTVWSVFTQKFVIKAWCTLCLTVQSLLWCLFVSYLLGGAWHGLEIGLPTFVVLGGYIAGVLLMNLVNMFIAKAKKA